MRKLIEISVFWVILTVCGCRSPQPVLPEISMPKENLHGSTGEQWQKALTRAGCLYKSSYASLNEATAKLYLLVDPERKALIVPLIKEPPLQREIIARALEMGIFTDQKLNKRQARQVKNSWQRLIQAEQDFLHAQAIVAKLRGKWPNWRVFPDLPACDHFPDLARSLRELPTVYQLEILRDKVEILQRACRSLLPDNPSILSFP